MPEINATILIPDISGFTEFITSTELSHGSRAVNMLIDAIVNAVGDTYDVSEIEGDAVLLIKHDPAPTRKEIEETCLKIFQAFHYQRKWISQHTICPCKACQNIVTLTLKFVVHHGPLAEIKIGRFVKHSGTEMIVAHRLLKNQINNNEYLLLTDKLTHKVGDVSEDVKMEWRSGSDEYASLGMVGYQYALLADARSDVPDPPLPDNQYHADDTAFIEFPMNAEFMDVYMTMMDIPNRHTWMPGLQNVEQEMPLVYVGSQHQCTFEDYQAIVSPLSMNYSGDGILYAERCRISELDLQLVHEFVFNKSDDGSCIFAARFVNTGALPLEEEIEMKLRDRLQQLAAGLKARCEGTVAA
jgi:hypothetical protein